MTSLISYLKRYACRVPRCVGEALAYLPYSVRPGFALAYRRAKATRRWFDEIATDEQQREFIFQRVAKIVNHAMENVPFYAHYYSECEFDPKSLRSFDDLKSIPIITKELLQTVDLERRSCKRRGRTPTYTGGSTGEPLKFYSDNMQIGNEWAHMHHIWESLGYRSRDLLLSIALEEKQPPIYYDALRHSLVLNIHYPNETIVRTLLALPRRKRRVYYFRGYPSSFAEFLSYCESSAHEVLSELQNSLKGCFLASEFPTPAFRSTIERATKHPSVSWYGHSERAILAWEKTRPYLYTPMHSYGYCETTRTSDGCVSLVGTSYWNFSSPFIRYQTNDGVRPIEVRSDILRSFEIQEGRLGDFIIDKNGERISVTHLNLSCRESTWELVRCVQIEQREPGSVILWVTPRRSTTVKELRNAFDFGKLNLDCDFRIVHKPFVTSNGKTLLKISTDRK